MKQLKLSSVVLMALVLSLVGIASVQAQVQDTAWSEPYRLSSEAGVAGAGHCTADQYGYVHCFWTEALYADQRTIIQYARFDGEAWTDPIAINVIGADIDNVSPAVDADGVLHIAWAEGLTGPVYYASAPVYQALSARNWTPPLQIDVPGKTVRLRVDSKAVLHLVYINRTAEPGLFYVRSEDSGGTWTEPVWLDPDILPNHIPDGLNFEVDEQGGLHVVWFYGAVELRDHPDWVRYAHSLDGGHTWSVPFLIDQAVVEEGYELNSPGPVMMVQGTTVHVIWAAGTLNYRHHRFSTDAGQTWSAPQPLFGELNGQAGDGMAVDAAGRVHYFAQIRYPQGIYHAYWDQGRWSRPALIYLILEGSSPDEVMGDRIHAHDTFPVVRAGNQLVLMLGDGHADPNRRLFAMHRLLDGVAPIAAEPTPSAVVEASRSPLPSLTPPAPTPSVTKTPVGRPVNQSVEAVPGPGLTLRNVMLPTLALLAGTVGVRLLQNRRRH